MMIAWSCLWVEIDWSSPIPVLDIQKGTWWRGSPITVGERTTHPITATLAKLQAQRKTTESDTRMKVRAAVWSFEKFSKLMRCSLGKEWPPPSILHDGGGKRVSGCEQNVEHFSRLLNRPLTEFICVTSSGDVNHYEIDLASPDELEITLAVHIKKNIEDGTPSKTFKSCSPALISSLTELFCPIWDSEIFPKDWTIYILFPISRRATRLYVRTAEVPSPFIYQLCSLRPFC